MSIFVKYNNFTAEIPKISHDIFFVTDDLSAKGRIAGIVLEIMRMSSNLNRCHQAHQHVIKRGPDDDQLGESDDRK
jgi:hypothetical protein